MPSVSASSIDSSRSKSEIAPLSWRSVVGIRLNQCADRLRSRCGFAGAVCAAIAAVFEAFSVGLMRRSDMQSMVQQTYQSRPEFYDPRRYQLPYEEKLLPELLKHKSACRLLDAFCGQGREAKLFADAGYNVIAIDQLDWMIAAAKQYAKESAFEATFITADFSTFQPEERFDVVYSSCWMYSTVQGAERRGEFLANCRSLCADDGIIVISFVGQQSRSKYGEWMRFAVARITAWLTLGNFATEFGERLYTGLFWHHLSIQTVEREVTASGLTVVQTIKGSGMEPTFLVLTLPPTDVGT